MTINTAAAVEELVAFTDPAVGYAPQRTTAVVAFVAHPYIDAPANDCWVWDGTTEQPANVTLWDGAAEQPATLEVAP